MSFDGGISKNKKKKKKSYMSRAKKFGKSGRFGKGSYISEDVYNYFLRVMELDNAGFPTDEEREMFICNTFEQTVGQEVLLATNQLTSVALERLIKKCKTDKCIIKFMGALAQDMRPILNDCFASHVFETLLKKSSERIKEMSEDGKDTLMDEYSSWIIKVGRFFLNNLEDFMWDQYANQIMRTVLETSSGTHSDHLNSKTKLPKNLRGFFKDFCVHVQAMPQLGDMTTTVLTSGFLQTLVKCSSQVSSKLFIPLAEKLVAVLETKKSSDRMEGPCWRLLESIIVAKNADIYQLVLEKFLKGDLKSKASDPHGNFCVQRLLENCQSKEQLEEIYEEINSIEVIEHLITVGHVGVVRAMGEACKNLSCSQGNFCQNLIGALHCNAPSERVNSLSSLVISLKDYEKFENFRMMNEEAAHPVALQGSLLLQACLNFNKPIKFVQSILSLDSDTLVQILSDPKGCHITDAFVTSKFVGEKSREKLFQCLKGKIVDLGCSKFGSRSLDAIWKASSMKMKQSIVNELSNDLSRLKGDPLGRFIINSYGVELFKHHPEDWAAAQSKEMTAKKLFADILGDEGPPSKKLKNK